MLAYIIIVGMVTAHMPSIGDDQNCLFFKFKHIEHIVTYKELGKKYLYRYNLPILRIQSHNFI